MNKYIQMHSKLQPCEFIAAIINIFIWSMSHVYVKETACGNKAENYDCSSPQLYGSFEHLSTLCLKNLTSSTANLEILSSGDVTWSHCWISFCGYPEKCV